MVVSPEGKVIDAKVVESDLPEQMQRAAIEAAKKGKFRPKTENGKPVETTGRYTVKFKYEK